MSEAGNIPNRYVWEFAGDPTSVSTGIINPGKGSLVIDPTTPAIYQKTTGYGDNSGFTALLSGVTGMPIGGGSTLTPQFSNVRITHSTLTYATSVVLDFTGNGFQTVTLTGNITFTTSNLAACRSKTIRIIGDVSERNLTFPGTWTFVGAAAPATLAANKDAILTLTSFGATDADVVAAYAAEA